MASVPGLYGVDVARHDPQLDHVTGFQVVGVCSGDTEKVCGFVDDVHGILWGCWGCVGRVISFAAKRDTIHSEAG